jgi:hypothetical protein
MKHVVPHYAVVSLLITALMTAGSCSFGPRLNVQGAGFSEVTGTYTLIFYGCNYFDDLETVAILGKEGGKFVFEPYAPQFNYRTKKGLPAKEALEDAARFIHCHSSYKDSRLSSIVDNDGNILGYELRPIYFPFTFGTDDVLDTFYWIRDDKINVSIKLKPSIERLLSGGGVSRDRN